MLCCYAGEKLDHQYSCTVYCVCRPDIIESERDGNKDPPIQCVEKSKKCSSSRHPGSSAQDCRHVHQGALRLQVLGRAVRRRHYCSSSRCCCGSGVGAPTHGKSCGSGHMHGATRLLDGSGQARQDEPAWTSPVRRRCHRTFGSGGGG